MTQNKEIYTKNTSIFMPISVANLNEESDDVIRNGDVIRNYDVNRKRAKKMPRLRFTVI